ncbi:MAG: DinB family protein [Gemmatimonadota bacterium]
MTGFDDRERRFLRHFLAAIAYRTQKALRGAPDDFGAFRATTGLRTPQEIVRHMTSVLGYGRTFFTGGRFRPALAPSFEREIARFHEVLADLSRHIDEAELRDTTPTRLLQGPLADAMTHVGQLAMLRRLAGSPVPPENFIHADVRPENVGPDQPVPASPDRAWYSAEEEAELYSRE